MKKLKGKIVKTKMNKTATVEVIRLKAHPIYRKRMKIKKKFHAHDELGTKVGDRVIIVETRPISKIKKWKVSKVIEK